MDRTEMFRLWLARMTPQKVALIVRLEKISRMLTHIHELSGTWDEKLLLDLVKTSKEIKGEYSERYENDTKTSVADVARGTTEGSGEQSQINRLPKEAT